MAAYAALVSLTHILDHMLQPPPWNQIIIVREQTEFLLEKVSFLIDFLETFSNRGSKEIQDLEMRIADAAYEAEDIIEPNIVKQIQAKSVTDREKISTLLTEGTQAVIGKFLSIEKELVEIKDKIIMEDLQPRNATASSSRSPPSSKCIMVGFDEHLIQVMHALSTDESSRQIIPIVGMGGIGKTTLATNIYNNSFIREHFQIRAWITITLEYTIRELLLSLLHQIDKVLTYSNKQERNDEFVTLTIEMSKKGDEQLGELLEYDNKQERSEDFRTFNVEMSKKSDDQLGELLHKKLFGRKYLIVMDDMWNIHAWDELKKFLPNNDNGSRILVTTRILKLGVHFRSCNPYQIDFLDEEQSWELLRQKIFAEECCPSELEETGKNIAKRCRGLPLALVVIGGLLSKSKKTRQYWEHVEGDITSALNHGNDKHFLKILSLSYHYLPINLKPCFLYLAVFPEDFEIHVSRLVRLWVAEGIIKPTRAKSLEDVAEELLEDLIDRNLILVGKRGSSGKVKTCGIHDLLRNLCRREAHKNKFLHIARLDNSNILSHIGSERRLAIHHSQWENKVPESPQYATFCRSLFSYSTGMLKWVTHGFSLLRVLDVTDKYSKDEIAQLVNSRYIACSIMWSRTLSSISLLWNLQTIDIDGVISLPAEIWEMPQLRHLKISKIYLPDPPPDAQMNGQDIMVLENLQTLSTVEYFRCTEQVCKRIPNLKKLGISYGYMHDMLGPHCLSNLVSLQRLESLALACNDTLWENIGFPNSLKKLTLRNSMIPWGDMSIVGSLPNLEVLKFLSNAAKGVEWNPIEGEFRKLKFLLIDECMLHIWMADNTSFPSLERLTLRYMRHLKQVPVGFAEIPTLQVIELHWSSRSLSKSVRRISKQREILGYESLQVLSGQRK